MQCPRCQHDNPEEAAYCNACAAPCRPHCPACATANPVGATFCHQCATSLSAPPAISARPARRNADSESRFHALLPLIIAFLQREHRVTYRTLKFALDVDDAWLQALCQELTFRQVARDEQGEGLVWTGSTALPEAARRIDILPDEPITAPEPVRTAPEAERRQLTVMFCDLVGSTHLSGQLDPEDLRDIVRAYQEAAAQVVQRYDGYIAQYLGDGLLIYFGFPVAHEDDVVRAVHTGLEIPAAVQTLNGRLTSAYGVQLAVRIGIHTGPVVVGEMGGGGRHENLALGETPNIAARLEGLAHPNTAVVSPVTAQLVKRAFVLKELGHYALKGVAVPVQLFVVIGPRRVATGLDVMPVGGDDLPVGRDEEMGLLRRRWEQSKDGLGQVILINGEPGIGKSALADALRGHVGQDDCLPVVFRCSPYHINSAFYPIIESVQRLLDWQPDDTADIKLAKLDQHLEGAGLALAEAMPLLATFLALPLPQESEPERVLSPEQQRQQTQDVLVTWLSEMAERYPVLAVWEDLHWADPSTLETLELFVEQAPTAKILHVLTFRPEFEPPWSARSHMTPITLNRLERPQVEVLLNRLCNGKPLPTQVVEHIVSKTDGVPLFVEELTKMLLASGVIHDATDHYELTGPLAALAIPDTLQDSLMARLDRMNTAKEVAQLGAVIGREFAYDMIEGLSTQDASTLQAGLAQLVESELLYQRGRPPRAHYVFKHALVQEAAYASLLRSSRQRYHRQMAEQLIERFPEISHAQPELVAHHYAEAACDEAAVDHWYQAGQRAVERAANREALAHFNRGLAQLTALAETPDRARRELDLLSALGLTLYNMSRSLDEVETVLGRALDLGRDVGETAHFVSVLSGLSSVYQSRAEHQKALGLGEQLLSLVRHENDAGPLMRAYSRIGTSAFYLGDLIAARQYLEQVVACYDPQSPQSRVVLSIRDNDITARVWLARTLWYLGYPDQARAASREACDQARTVSNPNDLISALNYACRVHLYCGEYRIVEQQADALIALSNEHDVLIRAASGLFMRGCALASQGQWAEGLPQMHQGLSEWRALAKGSQTYFLARIAEAYSFAGQPEAGLRIIDEAFTIVAEQEERFCEAELYYLKGILSSQLAEAPRLESERCFLRALETARQQEAKALELRAAIGLSRLWQKQGKGRDALERLAAVYHWFTEGFDTPDLQAAQILLQELSS
ncbi:adenylate/guanylate cyclase domain-containing protein [Candidatus Entotheonella palauensis]|uniref:adenylate/guanylate cyclase domain-containing protein n=1 Tax=Candidatus Entotheonella palauensis TaxID=93172 RepID=UPI000B7F1FCC|nr:adenylate/guanylate cyclase domain-containing protein [Candidatus Entotheonella palauensis]